MKLYSDRRAGNTVTAHGAGFVAINGRRLERSCLVLPDRIDEAWGPSRFEDLTADHLAPLAALQGTVILLGTGARQRFPAPAQLRPLIEAGIGVEVMDTGAASRTYNILMAEGRAVAAALIVERPEA